MHNVDVVIPCYNYGHFLMQCIESVLNQDGVDVRVLVIDDASNDKTPEIAQSISRIDSRIEYRRHKENKGHIATYNEGLLQWASADYSMLLSADDMLAPGALRRATDLMEAHPEVGMTYGMALVMINHEVPDIHANTLSSEYRILSGSQFLQQCFENTYCLVAAPSVVVRTEVQQRIGGYRTELPHSGDAEMWMRFGFQGAIGVLRAVQAWYRWHDMNMSTQYYAQRIGDQREFWHACKHVLDQWGQENPESSKWMNSISTRLGEEAFWAASKAFDSGEVLQYKAWLDFAEEVFPDIRFSMSWWRLRAKALMGQKVWHLIRPVLDKLRNIENSRTNSIERVSYSLGEEVGWWPG